MTRLFGTADIAYDDDRTFASILDTMVWHNESKSVFVEHKGPFIPNSQYHCWLWPWNERNKIINSHGIDLVISQYIAI